VLDEGWSVGDAAQAMGVSRRTAHKWLTRFRAEGPGGLVDRSSRPHRSPRACSLEQVRQFEHGRRRRQPLWRIAREVGRSLATVARHVARMGLSRLTALQPPEPIVRYERASAGELLHIDTCQVPTGYRPVS
jgi:transposase